MRREHETCCGGAAAAGWHRVGGSLEEFWLEEAILHISSARHGAEICCPATVLRADSGHGLKGSSVVCYIFLNSEKVEKLLTCS